MNWMELIDWLQPWKPYIAIALVSGVVNLPIAINKLHKKCEALPFFKPFRTSAYWAWILVNLVLPVPVFWLFFSLSTKPTVDVYLVMKAFTFGLVFTALANARVDTGYAGVNIDKIYNFLTQLIYDRIAFSQTRETAEFWADFEADLNQNYIDVNAGLNYLENYFHIDPSLDEAAKQAYQARIDRVRQISTRAEQAKEIKTLSKEIRRGDLFKVLERFKCDSTFVKKYESKLPNKTLLLTKP